MITKLTFLRLHFSHRIARRVFLSCQQKSPALLVAVIAIISQTSVFGAVNSSGESNVTVDMMDENGIMDHEMCDHVFLSR